jgi:thiamine transporter ThiT
MQEIDRMQMKSQKKNMGIAFFLFRTIEDKELFKKSFKQNKALLKRVNEKFYKSINGSQCELFDAPCPSDIQWGNFNHEGFLFFVYSCLLNICMFILTCIILSPTTVRY